eukprot:182148_1
MHSSFGNNTKSATKLRVHYGLQNIEFKNKLLVVGYCPQVIMNKHKMNIPNEIINYCITYFYEDEFDIKNIGITHSLNGNAITCTGYALSSSFLSNTVMNDKHIWRFKIKSRYGGDGILLGIWKTKSGKPPINDWFYNNNNGYGYDVGGHDHNDNKYGIKCEQKK